MIVEKNVICIDFARFDFYLATGFSGEWVQRGQSLSDVHQAALLPLQQGHLRQNPPALSAELQRQQGLPRRKVRHQLPGTADPRDPEEAGLPTSDPGHGS